MNFPPARCDARQTAIVGITGAGYRAEEADAGKVRENESASRTFYSAGGVFSSFGNLSNCLGQHKMRGEWNGSAANQNLFDDFTPGSRCEERRAGLATLAGRGVDRFEQTQIKRNIYAGV